MRCLVGLVFIVFSVAAGAQADSSEALKAGTPERREICQKFSELGENTINLRESGMNVERIRKLYATRLAGLDNANANAVSNDRIASCLRCLGARGNEQNS